MKPSNVTSVLLVGPKDSHKSSFLMQGAVHYAEQGSTVVYISSNELESLPLPIHGLSTPAPDTFSLIKFLYLPHWQDLLQHLFSLHLHSLVPSVIIVDALDHFVGENERHSDGVPVGNASEASHAALVCAALLDGASVCAKRLKTETHLIVSVNQDKKENKIFPILDIFFTDVVWMFERMKGDQSEEFSMTNIETAGSQVRQYKIFFSPQSNSVIPRRISLWDKLGKTATEKVKAPTNSGI